MDFNNALVYDFEAENEYLKNEIFEMFYIRDGLEVEFGRIRYYDTLIDDYRKHIEHNNRLLVNKIV